MAVCLVCVWVAGCSPALNWRQVTLDGQVQALFPCRTETRAREGVPLAGRAWSMAQTACETQGMTFAATTVKVAPGEDREALREALAEAAVRNVAGRIVAGTAPAPGSGSSAAGVPATGDGSRRLTIDGTRGDGAAVRVEMLLVDRPGWVIQGAVVGTAPAAAAVEPFFDELARSVHRAGTAAGSP